MRLVARVAACVLPLALLACGGPTSLGPARRGDIVQLHKALGADLREGRLTPDTAKEVAHAMGEHELRTSSGDAAVKRVQLVRACALQLEDVLDDIADGKGKAAPLAALALLDVDRGEPDEWREHTSDSDPVWRSVGARTLTSIEHGRLRRELMRDPDERVRKAAVRASELAVDPADQVFLLELARLDPSELVQVRSVRALAPLDGPRLPLDLRDLWPQATPAVRQSIVASWAWPGVMEGGGLRELLWAAETASGTAAVIAGGILLRAGAATRGAGLAALAKAIQQGTSGDRALAVAMAPLDDPHLRKLVEKATQEADPQVQVAALSRLAREPASRDKALQKLGGLAASKGPASRPARTAMAVAGDRRVTQLLLSDGRSKDAAVRQQAAANLLQLGDVAHAAMFLADSDARVRLAIACQILSASERW